MQVELKGWQAVFAIIAMGIGLGNCSWGRSLDFYI